MINPNQKHNAKGIVTECTRNSDGTIRNLIVLLDNGINVESVLGLEHKTIQKNDRVQCVIGFRITSDRYVLESVKRQAVSKTDVRALWNQTIQPFKV